MKLKRIISMALATVAMTVGATTLSACETARPEVQINLSFQGETYELEYVLYRKIAPATVAHFLELAEGGYYNEMVVHDYTETRLYTGGYKYEAGAQDGGLIYENYYNFVKNRKMPHTVFDVVTGAPTYTLYGEFSANNFEVENGNLKEEFGSLGMYYTQKDADVSVDLLHPEAGASNNRNYQYNSATSLFFISLTSSARNNSAYCTFATLDEDSVDTLKALQEALADYVASSDTATESVTLVVDEDDAYFGEHRNTVTYTVLQSALKITSVTVKKF